MFWQAESRLFKALESFSKINKFSFIYVFFPKFHGSGTVMNKNEFSRNLSAENQTHGITYLHQSTVALTTIFTARIFIISP